MRINIIGVILLATAGLLLASCKKFLDVEPKHAIPDETAIVDKNSAEQALRGVYREAGTYIQSYVQLNIFAGGDVTFNNVGDPHLVIAHDYRADNATIAGAWDGIYQAINQANVIIQKVPLLTDPLLTDESKNKLLGEALFFRALAYSDLVRVWGGVPLKLTPTDNLNKPLGISRSTVEQTYAQIDADLTQAGNLLPVNDNNKIRASKAAVQALWSRLYLYEKKWQQAEQSATSLIDNSDFELLQPFSAWFKGDVGTKESILEIAYSAENPNGFRNTLQHQTKGGSYSIAPTTATAELLDDPAIGGGPTGRRSLIGNLVQAGKTVWYGDLYFRSPATDPLYVLRIAEQYLIRAEARVYNNDYSGALADINKIRTRANLEELTDVDDPQQLLLAIENERRFEFLWEGDRWPDLVRTGRAKAVFQIEDYKLLYPIPLDEIVIGKLEQNP
ncbi:MAG: RagB/SusD family nutrient uptake outer membrane protein [Bacteroidota bacterium]